MSKRSKEKPVVARPPNRGRDLAVFVVAAVVGLAGGYGLWKATHSAPQPSLAVSQDKPTAQDKSTSPSVGLSEDASKFQMLKGKWVRPDGGYIVEVKNVDEGGRIDATYSNPQPIEVAKAKASQDGATIRVFLELQGTNYAGSTYELTYDSENDQLTGVYNQAKLRQRFAVTFDRVR